MRRCGWVSPCSNLATRAIRIGLAPHARDLAVCDHHAQYVFGLGFGKEITGWQAKRVLDGLPVGGAMGLTA